MLFNGTLVLFEKMPATTRSLKRKTTERELQCYKSMQTENVNAFLLLYPHSQPDIDFVNELCYLFTRNDFEAIDQYKNHPFWSSTNIQNIRHRSGACLLYSALVNIQTLQDVENFHRILTELPWSQEYLQNMGKIITFVHEQDSVRYQEVTVGFMDLELELQDDSHFYRESTLIHVRSDVMLLLMKKTAHLWKHHAAIVQRVLDFLVSQGVTITQAIRQEHIKQQALDICELLWWRLFDIDQDQAYEEHTYESLVVTNRQLIRFDWVAQLNASLVFCIHNYNFGHGQEENYELVRKPNKYYVFLQFVRLLGIERPDWCTRWKNERDCNAFFQVYPECQWYNANGLVELMMIELQDLVRDVTYISTAQQHNMQLLSRLLKSNNLMQYIYRLITEYNLDVSTSWEMTALERVDASFYFPNLDRLDIPVTMKVHVCFYRLQLFCKMFTFQVDKMYLKQLMISFLRFVPQIMSLLFEPLSQIEYDMSLVCYIALQLVDAYIYKTSGSSLVYPMNQDITRYVFSHFITYNWKDAPNFWPMFVRGCFHGLKYLRLNRAETEEQLEQINQALCYVDSYQAFVEHQVYAWIRGMCLGVSNRNIIAWCDIEMQWVHQSVCELTQDQTNELVRLQRQLTSTTSAPSTPSTRERKSFKNKVFECSDLYKKILSYLI
jgi:hypothetical protein